MGCAMAISTQEKPKDRRFQLRATAREETLIKIAAERQGANVTDFILSALSAAREKAEEMLADQTRFVLREKQWREFMDALDWPARENASASSSGNLTWLSAAREFSLRDSPLRSSAAISISRHSIAVTRR